ncbi:hypothetical protein HJC99_03350 [Candidatus Saccharibacteria bacterium]|nr:hypothetical protein [Candidatus Saccharibacteria bacterium]
MKHKIMSTILVLIVIGVIASAAGGSKKAATSGTGGTAQPQTATVVDVKAFGDEFDANQVAAENKYKNKLVQFTAPISNITDTGLSFQNVTSKEFSTTQISCNISDKNSVLSLKNGESATVKGTVTGQTIGVIELNDCSIVK